MSGDAAKTPVFVTIDFETSGYYRHSACAVGMARIENMELTEQFYELIRPPSSRVYFTHIHGLRWADLKNARPFASVWRDAAEFMKGADFFIAHNAVFDRGVLYACCREFNQEEPDQPFLCTLKGARKALKLSTYKLNILSDYFGFELDHHNAASDAWACGRIFLKLRKMGLKYRDMLL